MRLMSAHVGVTATLLTRFYSMVTRGAVQYRAGLCSIRAPKKPNGEVGGH